jgi:hypothetical protein
VRLMQPVTEMRLSEWFGAVPIERGDAAAPGGQQLRFRGNPRRVIVVHLAETDSPEYCIDVVARMLETDDEWMLITRYGSIADLGLLSGAADAEALSFAADERTALATYLCRRSTGLSAVSADLYVAGRRGQALVTWDHHSADEGISMELQSVTDAGRLLVSLNELGVELELFYSA